MKTDPRYIFVKYRLDGMMTLLNTG